MGRTSEIDSLRILEAAYEHGIRHFDVAPMYGYGQAEAVLGKFLKGKRDRVSIATKAGLVPPKINTRFRMARSAARALVSIVPSSRKFFRLAAASTVRKVPLSPEFLRKSLHASLRAMCVSHVDIFLLHECEPIDFERDELFEELEKLTAEGLIRTYGTGSKPSVMEQLLARHASRVKVAQFENNAINRNVDRFNVTIAELVITHSAVGPVLKRLQKNATGRGELTATWQKELGLSTDRTHDLARLLLAYAMHKNPKGGVLFSTLNAKHLKSNTSLLFDTEPYSLEQFERLEQLAAKAEA